MQKRPTWKYPKDFWQRYKSNAVEESYIFQQTVQEQLDIHGGKIFLVAGKESSCNAGDPSLSPGSGKSPGKEIGYPLQYSWAFLVAQMIKNPLAIRETWVQSLGWEDPLEKGTGYPLNILASCLENSPDRGACQATVHGVAESQTQMCEFHFQS